MSTMRVSMVVLFALVGAGALLLVVRMHASPDIAALSDRIVQECNTGSGNHSACYETEVPQLYPELTVPQLFDVVRAIRKADTSYQFCHVLAHKVGERVVAQDPDAWINAIPQNPPDGYCSNGFIHGVIGGRFRSEVLSEDTLKKFEPDFRRACEPHDDWNPSDLDKAICYHGMGHLYDFITNADLSRALSLCEQTTPAQFRRVCIEGVFMQIYQPLEPDDYVLIEQMKTKPTLNTLRQFCAPFKDPEYVGACLRESWPLHKGMTDGTGADAYCAGQPNAEQEKRCYQAAFSIIGRQLLGRRDDAARACERVKTSQRGSCFSVVANSIIEEGRSDATDAVAFCTRAGDPYTDECLSFLLQTASFNFGTNAQEYAHFCAALPQEYRVQCDAGGVQ